MSGEASMLEGETSQVFNTPVECGLRSVCLLMASFPRGCDVQRLVQYDYLVVHSGDIVDGPPSIHPAAPHRSGELLVRRSMVQQGLAFMMKREIVQQSFTAGGIEYTAGDYAVAFLESLNSTYARHLKERANWVVARFQSLSNDALLLFMQKHWSHWGSEFALSYGGIEG